MINHLDNLIRHLFIAEIDDINEEGQVGFQPPDDKWRGNVVDYNLALNVYLADVRENRKLRSNQRERTIENGMVNEKPAPSRIDCHYLISAWSPATDSTQVEATTDEHELLYKTAAVLMKREVLIPGKIYAGFSEPFANLELPIKVLPEEGFGKLSEFWGTVISHWKPVIYLVVTMPVIMETRVAGPMVTTRITRYRQTGKPETALVYTQIGGTVWNADGKAISGAWVRLENESGEQLQTTYTDEREGAEGRFTFLNLKKDTYRIRVRSKGFSEVERVIYVPSPTGEYDITLT